MPNRIIRDAILTSVPVSTLGWPEEVLYRRLMSVADDYGRCDALPQLVRSRCYPLQTDQVRVADITRWLAACEKAGLIVLYEADGKPYLQIEKFGQQQRSASKFPPPPANASKCEQMLADEHLGVVEVVSVSVFDPHPAGADKSRLKASTRCPESFEVTDEMRQWAKAEFPSVAVDFETGSFRDYTFAKARSDWAATWRNWIRKASLRKGGKPAEVGEIVNGVPQAPKPEWMRNAL